MKLIIYPDVDIWNYMVAGLKDRNDIFLFPLNRHCNRIQQAVRKYSPFVDLPENWIIGKELRIALQQLTMSDSLILCDYSVKTLLYAISKLTPRLQFRFLWLWNTIESEKMSKKKINEIKQMGYKIVTFNRKEAVRYNLDYSPQFFNFRRFCTVSSADDSIIWDFLFVGQQKNRSAEIEQVSQALKGYKCKFHVVRQTSDFISYDHYMELVMRSRCIVEIVPSKSPFCTIRPLEALATRRKLLTNNPDIRQYSFFNSQNVFILGEDRPSDLSTFLRMPFEELSQEVLERYDINSWADSFRS